MPSTVIISSPRPNNLRIAVMKQTITAEGAPTGEPEHLCTLDDGGEFITEVSDHHCLVLLEIGRDAHHAISAQTGPTLAAGAQAPLMGERHPSVIGAANDGDPPSHAA